MKNIRNVVLLLITVFMCFSVACTGDPAEEVTPQIKYNNFIVDETTTTITQTQQKFNKNKKSTKTNANEKENKKSNKTNKTVITKVNNKTKKTNKVVVTKVNNKGKNTDKIVVTKVNNKGNNTNKVVVTNIKTNTQSKATNTIPVTVKTTFVTTTKTHVTITTTLSSLSDSDVCYVTASGEKYHRQGCRYLSKSCIEMIVKDAKEKKYTPCKICKP